MRRKHYLFKSHKGKRAPLHIVQQLTAENFLNLGKSELPHRDTAQRYLVNRGTQTDLRDGEAQTHTWTPPHSPRLVDTELLSLRNFHFDGDQTTDHLEALELLRDKAEWDTGNKDGSQFYRWLQRRESKKLIGQEEEMSSLWDSYLDHFELEMEKRQNHLHRLNHVRLECLWELKVLEHRRLRSSLRRRASHVFHVFEHQKGKLISLQNSPLTPKEPRFPKASGKVTSHIEQYEDFGSSGYLKTYKGLASLETSVQEVCRDIWDPPIRTSLSDRRYTAFLKGIRRELQAQKEQVPQEAPADVLKLGLEPSTPTEAISTEDTKKNIASLILKKFLRGRATQVRMQEVGEKHQEIVAQHYAQHDLRKDPCAGEESEQQLLDEILGEILVHFAINIAAMELAAAMAGILKPTSASEEDSI